MVFGWHSAIGRLIFNKKFGETFLRLVNRLTQSPLHLINAAGFFLTKDSGPSLQSHKSRAIKLCYLTDFFVLQRKNLLVIETKNPLEPI